MSNIYRLGNLLDTIIDNRGKTPPLSISGIPLIETNAIKGTGKYINYEKISKYVSIDIYNSYFRSGNPQYGDILISLVGTLGEVAYIKNDNISIAQNIIALRFKSELCNSNFMYYLLNSNIIKERILKLDRGTAQPNIKVSDLKNIKISLPPIINQQKIANFLDEKCGVIDELTKDIQSQIETLENYKKSIITEAVTKGLNPNVEMKDSGIEWIGMIPKHWDVIATKYCFYINNGSEPITSEGDTPVYGSGSKSFKTCVEYKEGPTVLLGRKGTINIPQWIEGNYWNVDTAFDVKSKGNYNLKLFYYASICFDYDRYSTQTALPSMTQGNYNNFKLPYMNKIEQQEIVEYLDNKCNEIESLINDKKKQLEILEQYKKSIIYEYVTGKKEVI